MRLRGFRPGDAALVCRWLTDERQMHQWSADSFSAFPLRPGDLERFYEEKMRGQPSFRPLTAVNLGGKPIGQLFMVQRSDGAVRIGFVILDPALRGRGYGRKLMERACRYAFSHYDTRRLSLGVFRNNPGAQRCYQAVGFTEAPGEERTVPVAGESWKCVEMVLDRPGTGGKGA